jgi:uncharacterized protein YpuA (DUF1002 family)
MIINREENTTIITREKATIVELVNAIEQQYDTMKNDNIIVNLFSIKDTSLKDCIDFLRISNRHRAAKHSFVIVSPNTKTEDIIDELVIVPTLKEAYDIIEMEEIERDLGF